MRSPRRCVPLPNEPPTFRCWPGASPKELEELVARVPPPHRRPTVKTGTDHLPYPTCRRSPLVCLRAARSGQDVPFESWYANPLTRWKTSAMPPKVSPQQCRTPPTA